MMAETEKTGNNAPKCGWPIEEKHLTGGTSTTPCGSQEKVWVSEKLGHYNRNVCDKHLNEAMRKWSWDSIRRCETPGG